MVSNQSKRQPAPQTGDYISSARGALALNRSAEVDGQAAQIGHMLLNISKRLNSTIDVEKLLEVLIQEAIAFVGAESGCAGLYTPQGMVCHSYFQNGRVLPLEYCWPPGYGLPGWLILHKAAYLTNDALADPQIVHELCLRFGVRSALSTPLLDAQGELLGFFELHNKRGDADFTLYDQEMLLALAHLAAIALGNALTFQRLQEANRALQLEIEERQKVEAALRTNEQRFRAFVEHSADAILVADPNGNGFYISPAIQRILGYTQEEFVSFPNFSLLHTDDIPILAQAIANLQSTTGLTETCQVRARHKDGSWRWTEITATNLPQEVSEAIFVANVHDITERKQAEEALAHLAAIVASSNDAILSKDLQGIITSWNAAAVQMYGYSAQEIIGRSASLLFTEDGQDEFRRMMERMRRSERVEHFETIHVRKDGTALSVSVSVSPIKDSQGTLIGTSTIAHDITDQQRLEMNFRRLFDSNLIGVFISDFAGTFLDTNDAFLDILGYTRAYLLKGPIQRDTLTPPEFGHISQRAIEAMRKNGSFGPYEKEYLRKNGPRVPVLVAVARIEHAGTCIGFVVDISERKELDKRKDEFISMASHELKTPVTSLKGFLSLLQRSLKTQEGAEKELHYLARMHTQIDKLTTLINDLLDISKMQTGQLIYREERFALAGLVQEIVESIQETAQKHHLSFQDWEQVEVFGDRDRIGQVIINLLTNAIKYSPQADRVLIRVARSEHEALVSVQDFGIGIAEEYQQKIFERFYQVTDATEKTYPGLGIGLYICGEIVKRHNGRLWVESRKGEGSTFYFALPLVPQNAAELSLGKKEE